MTMIVRDQSISQNASTGQVDREWPLSTQRTISCQARQIPTRRNLGIGSESFGNKYENRVNVVIRCAARVDESARIYGIFDSSGTAMWLSRDGHPMVFDVKGAIPMTDAFGQVISYEIEASGAEVQ